MNRICGGIVAFVCITVCETPVRAATASLQLTGLSLALEPTTFLSPVPGVGVVTAYFTTYNPLRNPLYDQFGGFITLSNELRPRSGSPGVYETDYLIAQSGSFTEYGWLTLNLPTADTNSNGLPDFMELGRSISIPATGLARSDTPVVNNATVSGLLTRTAGSTRGNYDLTVSTGGFNSRFAARIFLLASTPSNSRVVYTRGSVNNINLQFEIPNQEGILFVASANSTFSVASANSASIAAFTFVGPDNRIYSVNATAMSRSGARYTGVLRLQDGAPSTSWVDYRDWHIEIVDANDGDGDGIPDFSDDIPPLASGARLINVSTRANAGSGEATLIVGFIIDGTGSKTLLIRGVGPKLLFYGVTNVVSNPAMKLYSGQTVIAENDDWNSSLAPDFSTVGAFGLDAGSKDAAMKATLPPGAYTIHLVNTGPVAEALVEVYDFSKDAGTKLINLSCRLNIASGDTVIVGTILEGGSMPLIVRNIGPGLTPYDVTGILPDPKLRFFSGQDVIAENDDWSSSLATHFNAVGAFPLTVGSKDAAHRLTINPGSYTVHATGTGPAGVALVELYESK